MSQQPPYPNNEPTIPSQPYTQYPPTQPSYPQFAPPPPPKRKRRTWLWIVGILVVLAAIGYASSLGNTTTSTPPAATQAPAGSTPIATQPPAATPTPTHALKWTTVQTFKGNGTKKTGIFHAPDDWKILYTCAGFDSGVTGVLTVTVYGSDNSYIDGAINADCKANGTSSGETEEHQGGDIYLSIDATGDWTIAVQVLQ